MAVKEVTEVAKKQAEAAKKLQQAERKLKTQTEMMNNRLKMNEPLGTKHIDVKYAARAVEKAKSELNRLK